MVPGDNGQGGSFGQTFQLALPFAVKIFDAASTQIYLSDQGDIYVGDYRFRTFEGQGFYIYLYSTLCKSIYMKLLK